MLSFREILLGAVLPLLLGALWGGLARWRKWAWLLPLAAGLVFLAGYSSLLSPTVGLATPRLPPSDGSDWLFWSVIPAVVFALVLTLTGFRSGAVLGLWAGVVVYVIARPLVPGSLTPAAAWVAAVTAAILALITVLLHHRVAARVGSRWLALSLAIALGAAGVAVLSSNLRTAGVYGLCAGAAFAGVSAFAFSSRSSAGLALLATSILYGLLAGGRFYPEPGVPIPAALALAALPLLPALAAVIPTRHPWVRGVVAALLVAIAAAVIVAPLALAAQRAAEADPYSQYQ